MEWKYYVSQLHYIPLHTMKAPLEQDMQEMLSWFVFCPTLAPPQKKTLKQAQLLHPSDNSSILLIESAQIAAESNKKKTIFMWNEWEDACVLLCSGIQLNFTTISKLYNSHSLTH